MGVGVGRTWWEMGWGGPRVSKVLSVVGLKVGVGVGAQLAEMEGGT